MAVKEKEAVAVLAIKLDKKFDKNNVVRDMVKNYKLVPHLERAIQEFDKPWEFKYEPKVGDDAWHPSGDCTPTVSELYAKAKGELTPRNFSKKNGYVGHFWHQYLQWLVLHELEFCESEHIERNGFRSWGPLGALGNTLAGKIKPYHWARGAADVAPCSIPVHGDYVVDFKTMGGHDYSRNGIPNWCADKYECQINIYMDFFDIDKGIVVAIQKDTPHGMKEFEFHRNQALIDAIYMKWEFAGHCVDVGHRPGAMDDEIFDVAVHLTGPVE